MNEYVINWKAVQTVDDIKRILKNIDIKFSESHDITPIADLVVIKPKEFHGYPFKTGTSQ